MLGSVAALFIGSILFAQSQILHKQSIVALFTPLH